MDFKAELMTIEKQNKEKELSKVRLEQQLKTSNEELTKIDKELNDLIKTDDIKKSKDWIIEQETKLNEVISRAKEQLNV